MDKYFLYPVFWKGELYVARTHPEMKDYLLLNDDNGNLFDVPASEVDTHTTETDEIFDAECAADEKALTEFEVERERLRQVARNN
jgi:hypothetical protein